MTDISGTLATSMATLQKKSSHHKVLSIILYTLITSLPFIYLVSLLRSQH